MHSWIGDGFDGRLLKLTLWNTSCPGGCLCPSPQPSARCALQAAARASLPVCFKHKTLRRSSLWPEDGFIWGYVYFMCYWFCFDSITQCIRSAESRPGSSILPDSCSELCVEALKERVNEVKINETRERRHLKAVCPLHAPFIMYDLNKINPMYQFSLRVRTDLQDNNPVFPWS